MKRKTQRKLAVIDYSQRNANLRSIGFDSYQDYLQSETWATIRAKILARDKYTCLCGYVATQVHHLSYKTPVLRGHDLEMLIAVCGDCHRKASTNHDGSVRPVGFTNRRLKRIVKLKKRRRRLAEIRRNGAPLPPIQP